MNTEILLSRAVKGALAVGAAGSLVGAGAALAQTAAPASGTAAGVTNLQKITVVGSHIPETSIATAQPVVTINRQQIEATGFSTVGQLLSHLSQAGSALNTQFNNGGTGAVFVNLHDLGSNRVLVLVDGQRWSTGLGSAVDLTTIPLGIVSRVEVLLNGAAAIYGSEAIAGVINIITVKNFNGAEANAYMGIYDATNDGGGWDGKTQRYSFLVGTSSDRSSVLLGAGYFERNEVRAGNRTISKEPFVGVGQGGGSAGNPNGLVVMLTHGQVPNINGCTAIAPGPIGYCAINGPYTGPNANPHPYGPADNFNFAPLSYLRTPAERWYIYSQGHYDLTNNLTFNFLGAFNDRTSSQVLAGNPFYFGAGGTVHQNGLGIGISKNAKYNPFGVDMVPGYYISANAPGNSSHTTAGQTWCSKFGSNPAGGCTTNYDALALLGFRPVGNQVRDFNQDVQNFYFRGGFNGFWMMAGNQWNWYANYIYSKTSQTTVTTGLQNTVKLQQALGPVDQCVGAPNGCVPFNLFGGPAGATQRMYNFVDFTAHSQTQAVIRDYNAGLAGNFFNGWYAGPWGVAAGYEYYEQDGFTSPDAIIAAGNTDGNVTQPTNGRIGTNAQYVELNVPLASDLPGAKEIAVDVANRWSQFHWVGNGNVLQPDGSVLVQPTEGRSTASTGRITFKWRPITQLLLRASWSQGFRAPSVSELFFGASDSFVPLSDPCAPGPFGSYDGNPAHLPPGCPGVDNQPNAQILTSVGGNAQLTPERSISRSVGFVYSPGWAPGLNFSADYYHVEVVNNIGVAGGQFLLNQCYISQVPSACKKIVRSGKIITRVVNLNLNVGSQTVAGYDLGLNYKLPITPVGQFSVNATANYTLKDINCSVGGCSDSAGTAYGSGFYGQPGYRAQIRLDWNLGPWAASWGMYIIGPMWESCGAGFTRAADGTGCSNPQKYAGPGFDNWGPPQKPLGQNHLGTTIYNDLQGSYTVSSWNTTFTLGINNIFDKLPPISRRAFANSYLPEYYRTPGRFIYGRISVNF